MIRLILIAIGAVSLVLAVLGAVLPLLPTTPFVLLSGLCFSKSSPRLNEMLTRNSVFGPELENWRNHGAISARAKSIAVASLAATLLVSALMQVSVSVLMIQSSALLLVAVFILSRPLPPA